VSTTVAPKVPPPRAAATAWSLPSRAVAAASGPVGLGLKLFFLALVNAFAVWAAVLLAGEESETMPEPDPPIPSEQLPQPRPVGD